MSQPIASRPGPEYSDVTEFLTWVGDFFGDGHAEILWAPDNVTNGGVLSFYSLPTTGGGRDYFQSLTDQESQIHTQDLKRSSVGWMGAFADAQHSSVLFYDVSSDDWWLLRGQPTGGVPRFTATKVGNTIGFGHQINDGRPFWVGDFGGDGIDEMLFYFPNDDNWWMARFFPGTSENPACAQLRSDIANLRIAITELKAEQTAAVNSDDRAVLKKLKAEIMAAEAQLASTETQLTQAGCAATAPSAFGQLAWQFVGNTIGYGHAMTSDGRPFWVGRFSQRNQDEILFYCAPLGHWHRGILTGNTMVWSLAGTTNLSLGLHLFSNNAGHAWAGDFDGDGLTELVYRVTNSPNFWMFDFSATAVTGSQVYAPPTHQTTVKVPSVVGDSLAMASNVISGASLKPNAYSLDGSLANQIVVSQDPAGGATVQQGAHINLGCVGAGFGVSTLHFFNCSEMKLHLWTSDDGDQTWHDEDTLDPPTADPSNVSNCPSKDIAFSKVASVDVVAVDSGSVPDVSPGDPAFNAAGIVYRAIVPGDPGGIEITGGKTS